MFDSDQPSRSDFTGLIKWGCLFLGALFALAMVGHALGVIGTVATAPGRVVGKTLETDNIIASYEWFYDTSAQFDARLGQIRSHTSLVKAEDNPAERSRLNIELAAMRQSCRDMAAKYNANSEKANKALFKSRGLPPTLQLSDCEA